MCQTFEAERGAQGLLGGLISSLTMASLTRDKQDRLIEKYGTLEITPEQIMSFKEEDELENRGSLGTRRMIRWMANNAPSLGKQLTILRNNTQMERTHMETLAYKTVKDNVGTP